MTILFFHNDFNSIYSGGIDRITYNVASQLSKKNIKVIFLCLNGQYIGFKEISELCLTLPCQNLNSNINIDFARDLLLRHQIDVIINQSAMSREHLAFLSKCLEQNTHVKIISCIHNLVITPGVNWGLQHEYFLKNKGLGFIAKITRLSCTKKIAKVLYILKYRNHYRNLENKSDAIVGLCPGHVMEIEEMLGHKSSKLVYIPNCIPNEDITEYTEKEKCILWVGRTDFSVKRLDVMIQVWQILEQLMPEWNLYILGSGSQLELAKNISQQLCLKRIHFEGNVNPTEYYKKASIACVTSSHESFSMVILEAHSYSVVPVVFNTFPAASYLINNDVNGILVKPYQVDVYANKIYELSKENLKLKEMQHTSYCTSKTFGSSNICNSWLNLFYQLYK